MAAPCPPALIIKRFCPPPIIHATPPAILQLRMRAATVLLQSLSEIARSASFHNAANLAWITAQDMVLPDLEVLPSDIHLLSAVAKLLIDLEVQAATHVRAAPLTDPNDPFSSNDEKPAALPPSSRALLVDRLAAGQQWSAAVSGAAKAMVSTATLGQISSVIRTFLEDTALLSLGKECVLTLWTVRLSCPGITDAHSTAFDRRC